MVIHAAALLPIAPLLLMPFIIIFFIAVFPLWLVGMIVLGATRWIVRMMFRDAAHPARVAVEKAFRWVLTFGGLIHLGGEAETRT